MTVNSQPEAPKSTNWLLILAPLGLLILAWAIFRGGSPAPSPTPAAVVSPDASVAGSPTTASVDSPLPSLPIRPRTGPQPVAPEPEPIPEAEAITAELRQQRTELFDKLAQSNDVALAAVKIAFETQGLRQPDAIAAGWILAQNWALSLRSEALASSKVQDPTQLAELAEARRHILIEAVQNEISGLLGSAPSPKLFADLETIGRSLKDLPPPSADLLPRRGLNNKPQRVRRGRVDLPSEEE